MWFLSHVNCCWWYLNVLLPLTGRKLQNKPNDFTYVHQIELHVIQRCLNEILTGVRKHDCQHNSVNLKVKLFTVRLVEELSNFLSMIKATLYVLHCFDKHRYHWQRIIIFLFNHLILIILFLRFFCIDHIFSNLFCHSLKSLIFLSTHGLHVLQLFAFTHPVSVINK